LNVTPPQFLLAGYVPGFEQGQSNLGAGLQVTLKELIEGAQIGGGAGVTTPFEQIWANTRNNIGMFAIQSIGLRVLERGITALKVPGSFNKVVRSVGMGDLVKM